MISWRCKSNSLLCFTYSFRFYHANRLSVEALGARLDSVLSRVGKAFQYFSCFKEPLERVDPKELVWEKLFGRFIDLIESFEFARDTIAKRVADVEKAAVSTEISDITDLHLFRERKKNTLSTYRRKKLDETTGRGRRRSHQLELLKARRRSRVYQIYEQVEKSIFLKNWLTKMPCDIGVLVQSDLAIGEVPQFDHGLLMRGNRVNQTQRRQPLEPLELLITREQLFDGYSTEQPLLVCHRWMRKPRFKMRFLMAMAEGRPSLR